MKIAKSLLSQYPDERFWKTFRKPDCIPHLQSLAQLLTEQGKSYLESEYKALIKSLTKGEDLTKEDAQIIIPPKQEQKPQNIFEFLRK